MAAYWDRWDISWDTLLPPSQNIHLCETRHSTILGKPAYLYPNYTNLSHSLNVIVTNSDSFSTTLPHMPQQLQLNTECFHVQVMNFFISAGVLAHKNEQWAKIKNGKTFKCFWCKWSCRPPKCRAMTFEIQNTTIECSTLFTQHHALKSCLFRSCTFGVRRRLPKNFRFGFAMKLDYDMGDSNDITTFIKL